MRNRAKCKLCDTTIESFHDLDYVACKCSEISVSGGSKMECAAKNWENFLRVDDKGNEIIVKVMDKIIQEQAEETIKPTKKELIDMLDEMIKNIENLPQHAMTSAVNHYDLTSALLLLSALFKAKD